MYVSKFEMKQATEQLQAAEKSNDPEVLKKAKSNFELCSEARRMGDLFAEMDRKIYGGEN